jgi:hypothetical protein
MASVTTLEMLPDELLLEVCKYLLCIDVLQSFFDLNERMTRLIKGYRDNVSLHKGSFAQCNYIYANVFPKIGSHIRTLVIDRLYSVLQVDMFYRYFGDQKLSNIFPKLEQITLVAFRHEILLPFVNSLENFEHLIQLNVSKLFPVPLEHQPTVLKALLTANNQKLKSVIISDNWTCLRLDDLSNISYSNITNLQITVEKNDDLLFLFSAIPNVAQLDITLLDNNILEPFNGDIPPLVHLTNFRLVSIYRVWIFEDLVTLLRLIPNVQYLSLQLFTFDPRCINGQQILVLQASLSHIRQFNYEVHYTSETDGFDRKSILASWPPSSIECLVNETSDADNIFAFIYTVSSCIEPFISLEIPGTIMSKVIPPKQDDSQVQQLTINKVSTFLGCLPVMARWHRVKELTIWFSTANPIATAVTGKQYSILFVRNLIGLVFNALRYRRSNLVNITAHFTIHFNRATTATTACSIDSEDGSSQASSTLWFGAV